MGFIFSEKTGVADSVFGKCQAPIKLFLEKNAEAWEEKSMIPELFAVKSGDGFGETLTALTAMKGFAPVGENGAYPHDEMQEGYKKVLEYVTWKDSFAVSKEIIEDSRLLDLKRAPANFLQAYYTTREEFGAALFGAAIGGNTSFTFRGASFDAAAADGKALFATNHKHKTSAKTQTNCFSNTFSAENLGKVESAMHLFKGDTDNVLNVGPNTIVIPDDPTLKTAVFSAIGSELDPATANNAYNYQFGRWHVIIWPYLNRYVASGVSPWILLDSEYNENQQSAVWTDRVKLEVTSYVDENTDANIWKGRARFNATFNDWRGFAIGGISGGTEL